MHPYRTWIKEAVYNFNGMIGSGENIPGNREKPANWSNIVIVFKPGAIGLKYDADTHTLICDFMENSLPNRERLLKYLLKFTYNEEISQKTIDVFYPKIYV